MLFFEWVWRCCELLEQPADWGANMMPEVDTSWFAAFDDGLTPEQAVDEYKVALSNAKTC